MALTSIPVEAWGPIYMLHAMEGIYENLTYGQIFGILALCIALSAVWDFARRPSYPKSIPRVGYGPGVIGTVKNLLFAFSRHRSWVAEGYEKYSKHGQAFVVPAGIGRRSAVILPKSQFQWLFDLPDNLASPDEANNESLYARYNFLGKAHPQDGFNNRTIHRNLIRSLDGLVPGMHEEVKATIDRIFGLNTQQWTSVNIWKMWLEVISQVTNRMILGKDLGRNPKLLRAMIDFTESTLVNIFLLDFLPRFLHPLLGPLLAIPNYLAYRRGAALTFPVIRGRLDLMRRLGGKDSNAPEDFITWVVRQALTEGNATELEPTNIAKRTLLVEVASIHTTAMTAQNAILDILASDPSILDSLREEAERVYNEAGKRWTKAALSKLYRIDSAIRESQRRSNFAVLLLDHKVVAPQGVTNKAMAWTLPYGSIMAINIHGSNHDSEIHSEPESFDAFRYSRPLEEFDQLSLEQRAGVDGAGLKLKGMVTTSDQHLVFGHGRHACPGRFFVALELKMAIAYMVMNYDIKHMPNRPESNLMGNFILPPFEASMEVRRRRQNSPLMVPTLEPDKKKKTQLTGSQATMLATLQGRVVDLKRETPILNDTWAPYLLDQIEYDFTRLKTDHMQSAAICMRTRTFDRWVSEFLSQHQDTGATVVYLACGLDSRSLRLDWGPNVRWIDIDMPDVVTLRRQLLPMPQGDYRLVASSVTEHAWLDEIPNDRPTLIVMEGLVMYLTQAEGEDLVTRLTKHFSEGQIVLDAVGSLMTSLQSWRRDGMLRATNTVMPWGWRDAKVLEKLNLRLKATDVVRFREQDGANELPLPVRGVAWVLSNVPIVKDLGWIVRYDLTVANDGA